MANALYDFGRESFLGGDLDWDADTIELMFIDEDDDVPNLSADQHHSDRTGAAIVATSGAFASKTKAAGVADAADVTVSTVSGDIFESIDIMQWTGSSATSILIANIDTATGLPCTPNGGDITVQWDAGANKIYKL